MSSTIQEELNLDRDKTGPLGNLNNAVQILEHDPHLKRIVWFDEFLKKIMTGNPPREWRDADDISLTLYMQRDIGIARMDRGIVAQAVISIAFRDIRNCVRNWLESLQWDQEPRIKHFFEDHFGAAVTPYTRAASKNFWLSIVARIYRPGCKVDNMIILEGEQGTRKGTALQIIVGDWFTEQH